MSQTTISSKYQIVIPKAIRERAKLRPGMKLTVLLKGSVISLVPEGALGDMFGAFPDLDSTDLREKTDREV